METWELSDDSGRYFLSLPLLLPTTSRDVLAELGGLIYGGVLKTTFSCVSVCSSVWATRQAFRLTGGSICISEGSRCSTINSNLEGKAKVKKDRPHIRPQKVLYHCCLLPEAPESHSVPLLTLGPLDVLALIIISWLFILLSIFYEHQHKQNHLTQINSPDFFFFKSEYM